MAIVPISGIGSVGSLAGLNPTQPATSSANAVESFQNLLSDALGKLQQGQAETDQAVNQLAAGGPVDLHTVALAVEENSLDFQLAMQVRNKLVDAYQEVVRMQV